MQKQPGQNIYTGLHNVDKSVDFEHVPVMADWMAANDHMIIGCRANQHELHVAAYQLIHICMQANASRH